MDFGANFRRTALGALIVATSMVTVGGVPAQAQAE